MTGHQNNPGTGVTLQMQQAPPVEFEALVRALGIQAGEVDLIYDPERAAALLDEAGWVDTDEDVVREKDGRTLHDAHLWLHLPRGAHTNWVKLR